MSIVVQCDRCENNNSTDPTHGLHTMYQMNFSQIYTSPIVQSFNLCDLCAINFVAWVAATIVR